MRKIIVAILDLFLKAFENYNADFKKYNGL